ncbi:MAG TPA: class I SAM-dependent methyltransferase [Patescibacteria group bacterium]|nr:class I SAM-dependent methyltransferase [Patescibacteria group bacterium]
MQNYRVDIEPNPLLKAQAEAISKGVSDRVAFRVADANYLPFQDQTFDGAIFQAALIFTNKTKTLHTVYQKIRAVSFLGVIELAWKRPLQKKSSLESEKRCVPQRSTLKPMKIGYDYLIRLVSRLFIQNYWIISSISAGWLEMKVFFPR